MNGVVIYAFTREQAIEDGVLVDLTEFAEDWFRVPVAVTSAVWTRCSEGPPAVSGQSQTGRVRDILWVLRAHMVLNQDHSDVAFSLLVQKDTEKEAMVTLVVVIGPGDDGLPVITVMFPEES